MQLSIVAKEVGSKSHLATSFIRMSNICHCDRMDTHTWHRSLHLSAETVTSLPSLQYCLIFSGSFVSAVTRLVVFGEAMVDHVTNLKSLTHRFFSLNSHTTVCSDSVWQCREWRGWNGDLEGERWLWGAKCYRATRIMNMNDVRITILDGSPDHPAESINHGEHVDDSSVISS